METESQQNYSPDSYSDEKIRQENTLRIGVATLNEIQERVKAYRLMNQNSKKKRFIVTREPIKADDGSLVMDKAEDFDISKTLLLKRYFHMDKEFKTFSPDEGIVIVSDMNSAAGIQLSMDLVTQIMNLGGGAYEAFIDRVDSVEELVKLYDKGLFPKLIVLGYLEEEQKTLELIKFSKIKKIDPHFRLLEVTHSETKPKAYMTTSHQVPIVVGDPKTWQRFVVEIISEYTRPYFTEQIT